MRARRNRRRICTYAYVPADLHIWMHTSRFVHMAGPKKLCLKVMLRVSSLLGPDGMSNLSQKGSLYPGCKFQQIRTVDLSLTGYPD